MGERAEKQNGNIKMQNRIQKNPNILIITLIVEQVRLLY